MENLKIYKASAGSGKTHALTVEFLKLAAKYPKIITTIEGKHHLAGIFFHNPAKGKTFVEHLNNAGLDISMQTYKAGCPPSALTKLPLIAGFEVVDMVIQRMSRVLERI